MTTSVTAQHPPLGGELRRDELEQILREIDANLAQHAVARGPAASATAAALPGLALRVQELRRLQAPLFLAQGYGPRALLRRLLNLPIRVFGRKQIVFNRELLALLEDLAAAQQGQSDWIRLLERKHQMLSMDVREQLAAQPGAAGAAPAARIVNPDAYQRRIAAMGQHIRVNLGCGEKPWADYINVDFRELPDVDVVAEVQSLPFEPGSLAELASAHLVEHFREHQLRTRILPYWKSLLRPGGALRIICPNWAAMLERLQGGRMSMAEFKLVTFGAQDYAGDDHFAMYTPETLAALLAECGFARAEVLATDRMNGICPEMEVLAYL